MNTGRESRKPPEWFVEELTRVGGKNRFGLPMFDLVWSETATMLRDGEEVLQCPGPPSWLLREWNPPEVYGPPELWESQGTGEPYPQFGKYEIVQPFRATWVENGVLKIEPMELGSLILNIIVPIIMQARGVSEEKRRLALEQQREREEKAKEARIADRLHDAMPAWLGPTSYEKQVNKTSLLERKMHDIQQQWNRAMTFYAKHGRGASVGNSAVSN